MRAPYDAAAFNEAAGARKIVKIVDQCYVWNEVSCMKAVILETLSVCKSSKKTQCTCYKVYSPILGAAIGLWGVLCPSL